MILVNIVHFRLTVHLCRFLADKSKMLSLAIGQEEKTRRFNKNRPTRSHERIDQFNAIDRSQRAHVFGVDAFDARGVAGIEDHAVPMGQAEAVGQILCEVERFYGGSDQREEKRSLLNNIK